MRRLEFGLQIEAVKHVPLSGCARYQARWYLDDQHKGVSEECPRVGDEVTFLYAARFGVDTRGVITQLLQVSLVGLPEDGQPELAGVLMIDLNAHIPKPPKTVSRQRATLTLARCPHDPPVLIRVSLECIPAPLDPEPTAPVPAGSSVSPAPRAPSSMPASARRDESAGRAADPQPEQSTHALVSALSSANDQLRDENQALRRALARGAEGQGAAEGGASTTLQGLADHSVTATSRDLDPEVAAVHEDELAKLRDENATLKRGLNAAKESLRQLIDKEREQRQEASKLQRAKLFLEEEVQRLQQDLNAERHRGRSTSRDAQDELSATREMLASSQQMTKDLRAMVHSADTLADSLKRELAAARAEGAEAASRAQENVRVAEQRAREAEEKAQRSTAAVATAQTELNKMHAYCTDIAARLKAANETIARERATSRQYLRQLDDLRAVASAQRKFEAATSGGSASAVASANTSGVYAAGHGATPRGPPVYFGGQDYAHAEYDARGRSGSRPPLPRPGAADALNASL